MGHSEISITLDTYTHIGLDDAILEVARLRTQAEVLEEEERGKLLKFAQ